MKDDIVIDTGFTGDGDWLIETQEVMESGTEWHCDDCGQIAGGKQSTVWHYTHTTDPTTGSDYCHECGEEVEPGTICFSDPDVGVYMAVPCGCESS